MTRFMNDQAVAERVLRHISDGTTDRGEDIWREPVGNYRSQERLDAEIHRVMRRTATPFCPSAALPKPGDYVARDAAGTPLLAVRGRDGEVRVFRNACRHRGTEIASGTGCAKALVCPYHGWSYRLDGRLQHIPHQEGFPGLDKEQHHLVPVAAEERLGLVFVTQDGASASAASEELPELISPEQQLIDTNITIVEANWKVVLEGFIEGYHIRSTHKDSFFPFGFDNLNIVEFCGRHSRVTFPFRRIQKLAEVPPEDRLIEGMVTYVYHLFPNTFVTILSHHTSLVVLEPVATDRTRFLNYTLTNHGGDPDAIEAAKRDAAFVNQGATAEDQAMVKSIQRSIGSGANECFTFGHFESALTHFHRTLTAALEA